MAEASVAAVVSCVGKLSRHASTGRLRLDRRTPCLARQHLEQLTQDLHRNDVTSGSAATRAAARAWGSDPLTLSA
jgi:hypothetical protein